MRQPKYLDHYRPNVGICLFNREGKIWLGKRTGVDKKNFPGADIFVWQMPQGGIDENEDVLTAAKRELQEETGITSARILTVTPGWLVYDFPEGYRKKKKWGGQRQKWVAMLFEGNDSEINLEAHVEIEFDAWRWADLAETPNLVVPFKQEIYQELAHCFQPLEAFIRQHKAD